MKDVELMKKEVLSLLQIHSNSEYVRNIIAPWIAKTSIKMGHLYSDLGLKNREAMGQLMSTHFTSLAKTKPQDVRWKKYLYDCIGKTAPACATCSDVGNCFNCTLAS